MELPTLRLDDWADRDLDLLRRANAPEMTVHLGGPESDQQIADRHARYLALPSKGTGLMFRVTLLPDEVPVGTIGFWDHEWRGEPAYETGWSVFPEFQGRGIAAAAARLVAQRAAADGRHRYLHAYPKVEHAASNAVCRRAGFTLVGEDDFEYPKGNPIRSNVWRIDLEGRR